MKAVIILPTYNERDNIRTMLARLVEATRLIKGYTFTILVVDDSSPDGTKTKSGICPNVKILSGKKEGLGKALRGMTYAVDVLKAMSLRRWMRICLMTRQACPFFKKYRKALTLWWEAGIYRAAPYPKLGFTEKYSSSVARSSGLWVFPRARLTGGYRSGNHISN